MIEKSVDVEKITENKTIITKTVSRQESSTLEGTIKQGVVVGGDSNPNAARISKLTVELLDKDKARREARRYGDKDKVERLKQEIEIIKKEIRELRKKL